MIALALAACARFPVEPARVWTGSSRFAHLGSVTLDATAGPRDAPTILAAQTCDGTFEQPPRTDCSGQGGALVWSFDRPSGVAAEVADARFDELAWLPVGWVGDVWGDGGADVIAWTPLADGPLGAWVLFDRASLPAAPSSEDGHVAVRSGEPQRVIGPCGDLDGDGDDELCFEVGRVEGVVVPGPPPEPAVELVPSEDAAPSVPLAPLGDLDGDGDDELLAVPVEGPALVWEPATATFESLEEGGALRACLGDGSLSGGYTTGDADGDGVTDVFDGRHLLHGPSLLSPATAGCDALVLTTWDDPEGRAVLGGASGDLDGDGVTDLVLVVARPGREEADLEVHRGPLPPGTFGSDHAVVTLPFGPATEGTATLDVADVDGDGLDDVIAGLDGWRGAPKEAGAVVVWRGRDLLPRR